MQDFFKAIVLGFRGILKKDVIMFAMLSGIVVSVIWIIIGFVSFDALVYISSTVLDLVPFSMVRADGAWMLSTFLWLQLVLITFALLFAIIGTVLANNNNTKKFTSIGIYIGLGSTLFWGIIWFFNADTIYLQLLKLFTWLPFETVEKSLSYLMSFYAIYTGIIVSMIFVASAFSVKFLDEIKKKEFASDVMYEKHEYKNLKQTLKDSIVFILISVVSFPLLFIPILNFIILVALWIWLMKDTLSYDVAAFVFGKIDKEKLQEYKKGLWAITFVGALFNFIPILNVFAPYFTQLTMLYYLKEKRD
jgi:hypothetical protein